jgi:Thiazole biosynthesis protein ThiG
MIFARDQLGLLHVADGRIDTVPTDISAQMAEAFRDAVRAGRAAYLAGLTVAQNLAVPISPEFGLPFSPQSSHTT